MANSDELNAPTSQPPDPPGLEQRVKVLEQENARLRAELEALRAEHEQERDVFGAILLEGMPRHGEEFRRMVAESVSFSDVLRQLEKEYGPGQVL